MINGCQSYYVLLVWTLVLLYSSYDSYPVINSNRSSSLTDQAQPYPGYKALHRQDNCSLILQGTIDLLSSSNLSVSCSLLQQSSCPTVYDQIFEKADPLNVFLRSSTCTLDMPEFAGVDKLEQKFPLAYFITAYTDIRNLELMLKTIFRPHNAYCIHVDPKADKTFRKTVQQILHCYKQKYPDAHIFQSSRSVPVYWGKFSIVEAEMICLSDLLSLEVDWKYAVNMAGSELMIFTNKELVTNLSRTAEPEIYVESFPMPVDGMFRVKGDNIEPVPFNLNIYKGAKSYRLPRQFVQFLLSHPVASTFLEWSKTTAIPDETVVPTLARISNMEEREGKWMVEQNYVPQPRYHLQNWGKLPCRGTWRNTVCVFSIRDLDTILQSGCYIVNKFRSDFHPYVAQCLTEIVEQRAKQDI